ncbi:MAG: hypothetical protein CM1200mP1_16540 [Candidatus Neomarinimicrobiota bacterium]|nr:MAG: hypothetical protein CM1200mP1_16540 [Candidatus Neomarinimicrobiota bacterium]
MLVLLFFWATWCIPCIKEMDVLSEFIEEYDDKVSVILNLIQFDPGKVGKEKSFVNSKKYLKGDIYHIVMDYNQKLSRRFNAQPIPLSFIVENNNIIYRKRGFIPGDENIFKKELDAIFNE